MKFVIIIFKHNSCESCTVHAHDNMGLISFVDTVRIQCVEAAYPLALKLFSGLVRPTKVVVKATNRGMTHEFMSWQTEMLRNWRSSKAPMSPVIFVTIHPHAELALGFPNILIFTRSLFQKSSILNFLYFKNR